MTLKEYRKKHNLTQAELAAILNKYAEDKFPPRKAKLTQRTFACWEKGHLPRKYWLIVISSFTNSRVRANDFIAIPTA